MCCFSTPAQGCLPMLCVTLICDVDRKNSSASGVGDYSDSVDSKTNTRILPVNINTVIFHIQ